MPPFTHVALALCLFGAQSPCVCALDVEVDAEDQTLDASADDADNDLGHQPVPNHLHGNHAKHARHARQSIVRAEDRGEYRIEDKPSRRRSPEEMEALMQALDQSDSVSSANAQAKSILMIVLGVLVFVAIVSIVSASKTVKKGNAIAKTNADAARSRAAAKAKAKAKAKPKAKPKVEKKVEKKVETKVVARDPIRKTDPPRAWKIGQIIDLTVDKISAKALPDINKFGGMDPFFEFRIVQGDPDLEKEVVISNAQVEASAGEFFKTDVIAEEEPAWPGSYTLNKVKISEDSFLQAFLWDYGKAGNKVVAHWSWSIPEALEGLTFDPKLREQAQKTHSVVMKALVGEEDIPDVIDGGEAMEIVPELNMACSYIEVFKWTFKVKYAADVPLEIASKGDAVELRIVKDEASVVTTNFETAAAVWTAKTRISDNKDKPTWDQEFKAELPADVNYQMQVILWGGDMAVCQSVMSMKDLQSTPCGSKEPYNIQFAALPGAVSSPKAFAQTRLKMSITHKQKTE